VAGLKAFGDAVFHPDGEQTVVDFTVEYEPEGVLEQAGDVLGVVGRRLRADLDNYARYVSADHGDDDKTRGHNPVADALSLNDPASTPSERITDRFYPNSR
jgi:hypothetical protein